MDIILHLGAHKTASTYLQKTLAQNERRLKRDGIRFHGPKSLRPLLAEAHARSRPVTEAQTRQCRQDCIAALIEAEAKRDTTRLILSDEQFLGSLRDMVSGDDFYTLAGRNAGPLIDACAGHPVKVMMAVRNYADFLASAYGQVLRGWRFMPFDPKVRESFLSQQRGWPELVDDIAALLPPGASMCLWRYEDFDVVEDEVRLALAGPVAPAMRKLNAWPFPGPSQAAIDCLQDMAAAGTVPDHAAVQAAFDSYPKMDGYPAFNPWSAEERLYLTARYRQDQIWLRAHGGIDWIVAPQPVAA